MIMRNKTKFFTVLLAVTIFFSCGNISDKKIRIAYANWAEGIAVTYLAKEILSEQGYRIELLNADIAPIFTENPYSLCELGRRDSGHLSGQGDSLGARIQNRTFECGHSSHIHFVGKR